MVRTLLRLEGRISLLTGIGFILAAHVGMDRAMLFGLQYPTAFNDTHLTRV